MYRKQKKNKYTRYSTDEDEENAPLLYNKRMMTIDKRYGNHDLYYQKCLHSHVETTNLVSVLH
jgi:hypothetical protein